MTLVLTVQRTEEDIRKSFSMFYGSSEALVEALYIPAYSGTGLTNKEVFKLFDEILNENGLERTSSTLTDRKNTTHPHYDLWLENLKLKILITCMTYGVANWSIARSLESDRGKHYIPIEDFFSRENETIKLTPGALLVHRAGPRGDNTPTLHHVSRAEASIQSTTSYFQQN